MTLKLKGIYINLDSRQDRREHFENLKLNWPILSEITRLKAIENSDGALGCCYSHLLALTMFASDDSLADDSYVGIFEDDFCILNDENFRGFIRSFEIIKESTDWDMLILTPRGITIRPLLEHGNYFMETYGFRRIIENQTTAGYIIKKRFIPILMENLAQSAKLQESGVDKNISAIDQYWKNLQEVHRFYYYYEGIFGGQLPSWSNIENRWVDYNDRFRNQGEY